MTDRTLTQPDLGPLEPLLADPAVTEIMVNGTTGVFVMREGQLARTDVQFESEDHILNVIRCITDPLGLALDARSPIVETRLSDGSRVNAVIAPIALAGPLLTIRKFRQFGLRWDQIVEYGSVDQRQVDFLRACVQARLGMVIGGGTSSGKTTVMNALTEFIPDTERVVTAEVSAELQLRNAHVVAMESRPPDADGRGAVTMTDLILNAQRMRPDRIITGEVQGSEAWDMLKVMTLGYDGSMFTIHADSPHDVLERLEMMCTVATNLPLLQIRARLAKAIDVITMQLQLKDGRRKLVSICEVVALKNNVIELQDIFRFEQSGEQDGRILGEFRPTGYRPTFAHKLDLPAAFFDR